jgi:hypothetical protein
MLAAQAGSASGSLGTPFSSAEHQAQRPVVGRSYAFSSIWSRGQQPRRCGPELRRWPKISDSMHPESSRASASTTRRATSRWPLIDWLWPARSSRAGQRWTPTSTASPCSAPGRKPNRSRGRLTGGGWAGLVGMAVERGPAPRCAQEAVVGSGRRAAPPSAGAQPALVARLAPHYYRSASERWVVGASIAFAVWESSSPCGSRGEEPITSDIARGEWPHDPILLPTLRNPCVCPGRLRWAHSKMPPVRQPTHGASAAADSSPARGRATSWGCAARCCGLKEDDPSIASAR